MWLIQRRLIAPWKRLFKSQIEGENREAWDPNSTHFYRFVKPESILWQWSNTFDLAEQIEINLCMGNWINNCLM